MRDENENAINKSGYRRIIVGCDDEINEGVGKVESKLLVKHLMQMDVFEH